MQLRLRPGAPPLPKLPALLLVLAGAVAALTCDDGRRQPPLAEEIARAFCARQFSCCSPFEISAVSSDRYATETDCVAFATLSARQQLGGIDGALAQGRITLDSAKLDACMRAYREQRCNTSTQNPQAISALPNVADVFALCPDLLAGHVPVDRACNLSQECAPGSRCVGGAPPPSSSGVGGMFGGVPTTTTPTSPGVCVPYQKLGERCNDSSDCDQTMHLACRTPEFKCGPGPGEGQPCTVLFDQLTGRVSSDCDPSMHLFCDNLFTFTCRHYPRDGEPCNQFMQTQCDPDPALALSCNPISGVCKRPGDEGAACGGPGIPPCRVDLACHPTQSDGIGVCGSLPGPGERCADRCTSPAICVGAVCTLPGTQPIGAPCTSNDQCASLWCVGGLGGATACSTAPLFPLCVGSGITPGILPSGAGGGFGGSSGFGGSIMTGFGGSAVGGFGGRAGAGGAITGAGGAITGAGGAGMPPPIGCPVSEVPIGDPLIADFANAEGGAAVLPIGGTFTYPGPGGPTTAVENGAWHVQAMTLGMQNAQYWGVGIYFNGNAAGTECVDAIHHHGVMFEISGTISGEGCSAQFAINDSQHTDNTLDPKGSGPLGAYAPQVPLTIATVPTTVMVPFFGVGAPVGGSPAVPVDPARLTGLIWQFTTTSGTTSSCSVDATIDNVRFF